MKRAIREMSKFSSKEIEIILEAYRRNELESAIFPFKGKLVDGVIWRQEDALFLIPIKSVKGHSYELPMDLIERIPEGEEEK